MKNKKKVTDYAFDLSRKDEYTGDLENFTVRVLPSGAVGIKSDGEFFLSDGEMDEINEYINNQKNKLFSRNWRG